MKGQYFYKIKKFFEVSKKKANTTVDKRQVRFSKEDLKIVNKYMFIKILFIYSFE